MVALGITLVITGSMYGLIASSQGAFRREPALSDRQQQIRIAMSRIREDVEIAGLGLGSYVQSFRELGNGLGMLGVRILGDPNLGGGNSDFLEIRAQQPDCPSAQIIQQNGGSITFRVPNPPPCLLHPPFVRSGDLPERSREVGNPHQLRGRRRRIHQLRFQPGCQQ